MSIVSKTITKQHNINKVKQDIIEKAPECRSVETKRF